MDERFLERLMQLAERAFLAFDGKDKVGAVADTPGKIGEFNCELFGGLDDFARFQDKRR